ncbi:MAG: hypothetical protein RTU92_02080 [Candidatus Thorarchaeota archaeon]
MSSVRFIDRDSRTIQFHIQEALYRFPLNAIPDELYNALAGEADIGIDMSEGLQRIWTSSITKPALCTNNPSSIAFPINAATKTVKLTLVDNLIEDQIDELEGDLLSFQGRPFDDTLETRFEIFRKLFSDDAKIDRFRLGAVEMYGGVSYANIQRDPRVTLNFAWRDAQTRTLLGFHLNCIAEIIPLEDPFFRFMTVLSNLFSKRFLDLQRPNYVAAYRLWVCEAKDKSLVTQTGFSPE